METTFNFNQKNGVPTDAFSSTIRCLMMYWIKFATRQTSFMPFIKEVVRLFRATIMDRFFALEADDNNVRKCIPATATFQFNFLTIIA